MKTLLKRIAIAVFLGLCAVGGFVAAARTLDVSGTFSTQKSLNNWIATNTVLGTLINSGTAVTSSAGELNVMDGVTATFAELNYVDLTTLGTGAASKAIVLDASGDYTAPSTFNFNVASGGDITLASGSTLDVAGTFEIANVGMTSSAAELNYNDITTLGTGAASKSVVLDASGDYTFPATGTIVMPSSGTMTFNSGSTLTLSGTNSVTSTVAITGNASDMTMSVPTNGGNANVQNEYVGIPRIGAFVTGLGTDGTAASKTVTGYIDETPAGEWTATANVTDATDSTEYRKGTASLELVMGATPVAGNGADNTLSGGDEDWSGDESFGFWHMCSVATTAGDWVLEITDSVAGATTVNVPAVSANVWTWVEVNISGVADASKDVITTIALDLSTAGAAALVSDTCNFDYAYKWDATEEDAMTLDVYEDGVMVVWAVVSVETAVNNPLLLVEGTDYFVHYEAGNDFLVWITDQDSNAMWGMAAKE